MTPLSPRVTARVFFDDFPPISATPGDTLLQAAGRVRHVHESIPSSCAGEGTCAECVVAVESGEGALSAPGPKEEFLREGGRRYRLACQARVLAAGDIRVRTFLGRMAILESPRIPPCGDLHPRVTRRGGDVLLGGRPIDRYRGGILGAAVDVGTTTVVIQLLDLATGRPVAGASFENPQVYGGSSVIHRAAYDARHPHALRHSLAGRINAALRGFPAPLDQVYEVAVSGNPIMRDILFGIDVRTLGESPFQSLTESDMRAGRRPATDIFSPPETVGIAINPAGEIYGLPVISGHVGADTVAGLMAVGMPGSPVPVFFLDLGTNSEAAIGCGDNILVASCAAGPAFEGGGVRCGMPAFPGAIDRVEWIDGRPSPASIGGVPPRGICGSGMVDALAGLRKEGIMDERGAFRGGEQEYSLTPGGGVSLSRRDVSALAQAKAAILAGQIILLERSGLSSGDLGAFYLAGGFSDALRIPPARDIGLLLPLPLEKFVKVGNASIWGARAALLSTGVREEMVRVSRIARHVDLEREQRFLDLFTDGVMWPGIRP